MKTKFSKTLITYFFPVGEEIRDIVANWVTYLLDVELWGNDDPLFPATKVSLDADRRFEANGLTRKHWSSAAAIRAIFRDLARPQRKERSDAEEIAEAVVRKLSSSG